MSTLPVHQQEKTATWEKIEDILGPLRRLPRRNDWRETQDKCFSIFVTYAQRGAHSNIFWYDISRKDLNNWLLYEEPYIVLIADNRDNTFVVPADDFVRKVIEPGTNLASDGTYNFHIRENKGLYFFVQAPDFPLRKYLNNFTPFKKKGEIICESRTDYKPEESEDADPVKTYREGATKKITVNAFERDSKARAICIRAYGTKCTICDFDFGKVYGKHGEGYIHVHHLKPLSEIGNEYELDPIKDLRPVCANCHAMIHRKGKLYSLEEIQDLVKGCHK